MGKGITQVKDALENRQKILNVLADGKWHRHKELLEKTGLSPTTLSKHLKELEKGIVEKKIDIESGEYPYPVYYRIKPYYITDEGKKERELAEHLLEASLELLVHDKRAATYLRTLGYWVISEICNNLAAYLLHDLSDEWLEQANEYFLFEPLREALNKLKEKLVGLNDKKLAHKIMTIGYFLIVLEFQEALERETTILEYIKGLKKEEIEKLQKELFAKLKEMTKQQVKEGVSE